jgi:thiol-disulfide isomerase/thioredoxin
MRLKPCFLAATITGAITAPIALPAQNMSEVRHMLPALTQEARSSDLSLLAGATDWLNSRPLSVDDLRGKVVLVNFWTYTCINWLRSYPYIAAWSQKYRDQGLVVIGVHSPEFAFEKDIDNVRRGVQERSIDYPIAVDGDHSIWRAFDNRYWPALYFIDAEGQIRHRQFGEGGYEESEQVIQRLLAEAGARGISDEAVSVEPRGIEVAADWARLKSPENYLGYERTEHFASPGGMREEARREYRSAGALRLNDWSLTGAWTARREFVELDEPPGGIAYRFQARDLHLVLSPRARGDAIRFRVKLDGASPGADHGSDVDADGWGTLQEPRLYQLIRQTNPAGDRAFEIEFFGPGARAYAFTFG